MGDDRIGQQPKKSGCLKWTCGCLVVVSVLSVVVVVGCWYLLSRWTPGQSAWENMPPGTRWAMETHDLRGLLAAASEDAGMLSLLAASASTMQALEQEIRELGAGGPSGGEMNIQALSEFCRKLGPFFTTLFPNIVIGGFIGDNPGELFIIVRPPTWLGWFVGMAGNDDVIQTESDNGMDIHYASHDGWLVVAFSKDAVQTVVDHWEDRAAPLGPALNRTDPFVLIASSPEGPGDDGADAGGDGEAGHFAFKDPFSATQGQVEAYEDGDDNAYYQILIIPDKEGWRFWGEMRDDGAPPVTVVAAVDAVVGRDEPAVELPDASDAVLSLRLGDELRERFDETLRSEHAPTPGLSSDHAVRGWEWLYEAWLRHAGGGVAALASRPVAEGGGDFPPLPVLSVGWELDPASDPQESAEAFSSSLAAWLEALRSGDEHPSLKSLGENIGYTRSAEEYAGTVEVPPVLLNAARPAWRFELGGKSPMGWVASDPSGLPPAATQGRLALWKMPQPDVTGMHAEGSWDMSRDFIDAFEAVARDRLETLPQALRDELGQDPGATLKILRKTFTAFPRGAVKAHLEVDSTTLRVKAFIPRGVAVDLRE